MAGTLERTRRIFVVEDNDADIELLREALADVITEYELETCADGATALAHVEALRAGRVEHPDLVLLDLNLPGASGVDVLSALKQDPELRRLPVVVLTTSHAPADIDRCYDLHANSYVVKATNFADFVRDIDVIAQFWLDIASTPPTGHDRA